MEECHHHLLPGEECQHGQLRPVEGRVVGQARLVELSQVRVVLVMFFLDVCYQQEERGLD